MRWRIAVALCLSAAGSRGVADTKPLTGEQRKDAVRVWIGKYDAERDRLAKAIRKAQADLVAADPSTRAAARENITKLKAEQKRIKENPFSVMPPIG